MVELWIQIENHQWDLCPNNIDRMTGQPIQPDPTKVKTVILRSPGSGVTRTVQMYSPLSEDALILRRYWGPGEKDVNGNVVTATPWTVPRDSKVNPWDMNESDPTDNGTMGTIPGPVIECSVGDTVVVHFRNLDNRSVDWQHTVHSLHPHGIVFASTSDGAFPLSPADPNQPVGTESGAWALVGISGFKQGDRVPPGGTFNYTWNTNGWPSTAGVWLYHDHSICGDDSIRLGAIGILVIHNLVDPQDFVINDGDAANLPGGSRTGSPITTTCFPIPIVLPPHPPIPLKPIGILPFNLNNAIITQGLVSRKENETKTMNMRKQMNLKTADVMNRLDPNIKADEVMIKEGNVFFKLNDKLNAIKEVCFSTYKTPPTKGLYLLLFHTLRNDPGMCINGRKFMGNTPTLIAGTSTKMRFGVIGMGDDFHTFHIHGHRWTIPGPTGNTPGAIQNNAQIQAVSQFEDTRTFGPANSFVFTIDENSFMGAQPGFQKGEWHLHCHVLMHMMMGMMGSLLIVDGGDLATQLPRGQPCPTETQIQTTTPTPTGNTVNVMIMNNQFNQGNDIAINKGDTVVWTNMDGGPHTVTSNPGASGCPATTDNPKDPFNSGQINAGTTYTRQFNVSGKFAYHCEVHGCPMSGNVIVT